MVEKLGEFEYSVEEGFVRISSPTKDGKYLYLVSKEEYGEHASKATRMFEYAYTRGESSLRRNLRELLGAK